MFQAITLEPHSIRGVSRMFSSAWEGHGDFPLLTVDTDSYISAAEIQSNLNYDVEGGHYCLSVGKYCAVATSVNFLIDYNHNHRGIAQGVPSFMSGRRAPRFPEPEDAAVPRRKGSIILQNDVWVGFGATILSSVVLHNGCVVGAESVVTKDVPPYAIVGGNPARIIGYRFTETVRKGLERIAWWNWDPSLLEARAADFLLSAERFVEKYLPEAEEQAGPVELDSEGRSVVLFIPDFSEPYPLFPQVLRRYFSESRPDSELLLYVPERDSTPENLEALDAILNRFSEADCYVTLQSGADLDLRALFARADAFITTRCMDTVRYTELADRYGVRLIFGTDEPMAL